MRELMVPATTVVIGAMGAVAAWIAGEEALAFPSAIAACAIMAALARVLSGAAEFVEHIRDSRDTSSHSDGILRVRSVRDRTY
jgi:hypothetical protein